MPAACPPPIVSRKAVVQSCAEGNTFGEASTMREWIGVRSYVCVCVYAGVWVSEICCGSAEACFWDPSVPGVLRATPNYGHTAVHDGRMRTILDAFFCVLYRTVFFFL